ncbi:hypothetical protein [Streptosporangium sp. NBC_01469]|uniref:hypothetical protein n=1 Tax=Streptosporangium sp. NBC_01469 TaxID=2903898 RepID=UPI002E29B149|nr:hypothetical protein [Streptosporangium sp. NBC_01469]
MTRVLTTMPAAGLLLLLLSGCAAAGAQSTQPAPTGGPQDRRHLMETMRTDCMERKGFKYVQNIPEPRKISADEELRSAGDYRAMMKYREKYGFGRFADYIYPDDPELRAGSMRKLMASSRVQADMRLQGSMSETQRAQWAVANDTCYSETIKELTGRTFTDEHALRLRMDEISTRLRSSEIDGDPELVRLARDYGSCLRDRGVRVFSLKPTEIEMSAQSHFVVGLEAVAQRDDSIRAGVYIPAFSAEEAAPYLAREVQAAIEDLECGRDFYAAHRPKDDEVSEKVLRELGVSKELL